MINENIISYVDQLIQKLSIKDYVGILIYGSYVGNRSNKLSDLDVMIIKKNYKTQDCGSLLIDGIRIEFFIEDIKKMYEQIRIEISNNDPSHLTKFATGYILYDKDGKLQEFLNFAKKIYNTKILKSFEDEDKFSIFSINNRIEDLESLMDNDSFYAIYFTVLERIRNLYCKINGIIDLPLTKIQKIYTDNNFAEKYISLSLHNLPSQEFILLYLTCLKIENKEIMFDNIKKLYIFSFEKLDFNPQNFHLKFKSKPPFRV